MARKNDIIDLTKLKPSALKKKNITGRKVVVAMTSWTKRINQVS